MLAASLGQQTNLDLGATSVVRTQLIDDALIPLAVGAAGFLLPGGGRLASRGRHRKDRPRYPNGQTKHIQNEIPEGIAMRRMAVLELSGAERDMRAESPLGVCRARGLILEIEFQAGERFERQHRRMGLRGRTPQACIGNLQPSGEGSIAIPTDASDNAKAEADYLRSREAVKGAGSRAWSQTQNIVIHHHWPRFLDTERDRPDGAWTADARDLAAFRAALEALARIMKLRGEKGDDLGVLLISLEEKFDRIPSDVEVAYALIHDSGVGFLARREQRLKREPLIIIAEPTAEARKIARLREERLNRDAVS